MKCFYCSGNHSSRDCPGYHTSSMNKSLEEINSGIHALSELEDRALEQASEDWSLLHDGMDSLIEAQTAFSDSITQVGGEITDSIRNVGRVVEKGSERITKSIDSGTNKLLGGILGAGVMILGGLVGIGAVLQYRERMDQLRHKERLVFDEENSDAGRARRELKVGTALLAAGDPSQAKKHIERSLCFFPSSAETFRVRSIIESLKNKNEEAIVSLKTALKLLDKNAVIPTFLKQNEQSCNHLWESSYTSCITQLANELAIVREEDLALHYLDEGLDNYPESTGSLLLKIRILSKTKKWSDEFEVSMTKLLSISPSYFNILFVDQQLGSKMSEAQQFLKRYKKQTIKLIEDKNRALLVLSKGLYRKPKIFEQSFNLEQANFVLLAKIMKELNLELKKTS